MDAAHSYLLQLLDRKFKVHFFSPQERNIPDVRKLLRAGSHEQRVCCRAVIVDNLPWEVLFSFCCGEEIVVWDVLRHTYMPEKYKKRLQCLLKDVKLVAHLSSRDALESIFPTFDFNFEFLHQSFLSKMKNLIHKARKIRSRIGIGATVLELQCPYLCKPSYRREVEYSITEEKYEEGKKIAKAKFMVEYQLITKARTLKIINRFLRPYLMQCGLFKSYFMVCRSLRLQIIFINEW